MTFVEILWRSHYCDFEVVTLGHVTNRKTKKNEGREAHDMCEVEGLGACDGVVLMNDVYPMDLHHRPITTSWREIKAKLEEIFQWII